jgi:hypothetical protein
MFNESCLSKIIKFFFFFCFFQWPVFREAFKIHQTQWGVCSIYQIEFNIFTKSEYTFSCDCVYHLISFLFRFKQENYDATYIKNVYQSPVVTFEELRRGIVQTTEPVRIQYNTKDQYKRATKMLGLMDDFKVNVVLRFVEKKKSNFFLFLSTEWCATNRLPWYSIILL